MSRNGQAKTWHWAIGALCLLGAACGQNLQTLGPAVTEPRLEADQFIAADGTAIRVHSWLPDAPPETVIIGVHGFGQYGRSFRDPAPSYSQAGIAFYAVDQRGAGSAGQVGLWPEEALQVSDLQAFTRTVQAKHPEARQIILGFSMGAAVTLATFTAEDAPEIDGLLLVSPGLRGYSTLAPYEQAGLSAVANIAPHFTPDIRSRAPQNTNNLALKADHDNDLYTRAYHRMDFMLGVTQIMDRPMEVADRLPAPTLMLYGGEDLVIECRLAEAFAERLAEVAPMPVRFAYYPDGWHLLLWDLGAEEVITDTLAWIAEPTAALPSGMERPLNTPFCP